MSQGSNTLTVRLMGGLGNQFFQYAFGRRLALANDAQLLLDASGLARSADADSSKGLRSCELVEFNIVGTVAERDPDTWTDRRGLRMFRKARRLLIELLDRFLPYYARREIVEPPGSYFRLDKRVYERVFHGALAARGFWQSEKYFVEIGSLLRHELTLRDGLGVQNRRLVETIRRPDSVAIHIRHGDNATPVSKSLGVLPLAYYESALGALKRELSGPKFFVFSDDIAWAADLVREIAPDAEMVHNGSAGAPQDLWAMSLCQHHVLANSTFGRIRRCGRTGGRLRRT